MENFLFAVAVIFLKVTISIALMVAVFFYAASTVKPEAPRKKKEPKRLYLMYVNILLINGKTIKSENKLKEEPTTAKEREKKHNELTKILRDQYESGLIKINQGLIPISKIENISIELTLIGSVVDSKKNTDFNAENGLLE